MIVIATHHKTGHHLMWNMFQQFSGLKTYDVSMMDAVPDDAELIVYEHGPRTTSRFSTYKCDIDDSLRKKGVHLIRHPYEVIISGYEFHKTFKGDGFLDAVGDDGMTYREHILQDGLLYEMVGVSRATIMQMYLWDYSDERFLNLKLEDLWEDFDGTIGRVADWLGLDREVIARKAEGLDIRKKIPDYATNHTGKKWRWPDIMTEEHFTAFAEIFPPDVMSKLGYDNA